MSKNEFKGSNLPVSSNCSGANDCCSSSAPCAWGEGDCDRDEECAVGSKCGEDNCGGIHGEKAGYSPTDDCCVFSKVSLHVIFALS